MKLIQRFQVLSLILVPLRPTPTLINSGIWILEIQFQISDDGINQKARFIQQ